MKDFNFIQEQVTKILEEIAQKKDGFQEVLKICGIQISIFER